MAFRKQNRSLISHIENVTKTAIDSGFISCNIDNVTKEDYLSINEWLFKTYNSIQVNYNSYTNCNITIGL